MKDSLYLQSLIYIKWLSCLLSLALYLSFLTRDIVKELTGSFLSYVLSIKDARSAVKTKKKKEPC